jgi:hypothetical protein
MKWFSPIDLSKEITDIRTHSTTPLLLKNFSSLAALSGMVSHIHWTVDKWIESFSIAFALSNLN